jgi:hypothetical protein
MASFLHHYCIIRADLPRGVQFAQLIHAAGESAPGDLPSDTRAVALEVSNEQELLELEHKLVGLGIAFVAIREVDEPYNNQLMSIGLKPVVRDKKLRKAMSSYKLVK